MLHLRLPIRCIVWHHIAQQIELACRGSWPGAATVKAASAGTLLSSAAKTSSGRAVSIRAILDEASPDKDRKDENVSRWRLLTRNMYEIGAFLRLVHST